jgi:hypothetical protein
MLNSCTHHLYLTDWYQGTSLAKVSSSRADNLPWGIYMTALDCGVPQGNKKRARDHKGSQREGAQIVKPKKRKVVKSGRKA